MPVIANTLEEPEEPTQRTLRQVLEFCFAKEGLPSPSGWKSLSVDDQEILQADLSKTFPELDRRQALNVVMGFWANYRERWNDPPVSWQHSVKISQALDGRAGRQKNYGGCCLRQSKRIRQAVGPAQSGRHGTRGGLRDCRGRVRRERKAEGAGASGGGSRIGAATPG